MNKGVFVIMPFSKTTNHSEEEWNNTYDYVIAPAIAEAGYVCSRAVPDRGSLINSIIDKLQNSWLVVADLTDRNANVFYELGVRHSISKRTLLLAQNDYDVPSDLLGYWYIKYGLNPREVVTFKRKLRLVLNEVEAAPEKSDSPVSDFLGRSNLSIHSIVNRNNLKKLTALQTELSGNVLELARVRTYRIAYSMLNSECLGRLLQTLYVDPGPKVLAMGHELFHTYQLIKNGNADRPTIKSALSGSKKLMNIVSKLTHEIASGSHVEPEAPSAMVWKRSDEIAYVQDVLYGSISIPGGIGKTAALNKSLFAEHSNRMLDIPPSPQKAQRKTPVQKS